MQPHFLQPEKGHMQHLVVLPGGDKVGLERCLEEEDALVGLVGPGSQSQSWWWT